MGRLGGRRGTGAVAVAARAYEKFGGEGRTDYRRGQAMTWLSRSSLAITTAREVFYCTPVH